MSVYFFVGGLILCVLEIVVPGFVLLPIGFGFILGGLAGYLFEISVLGQWLAVAGCLIVSWLLFKRIARTTKRKQIPSNMGALIGREGTIVEPFDAEKGVAYVRVYGDDWRIVWNEALSVQPGDRVRISSHDGNLVQVYKI